MPNPIAVSASDKTGVLLVNLGTPDAPTAKALKPWLRSFLSDRRVIETAPLIWQPLLRGVILNLRPKRSARAYAKIWRRESNESPLRFYTRRQAELLAQKFDTDIIIDWAMRYGRPSIAEKLDALIEKGCGTICVVALYPHYSATSTASVYDEAFRALMRMRVQPALRTAPAWYDRADYIDAIARGVETHLATLDWQPERVIASFHGLPQSYVDKGDPYREQCVETARLLRARLGLSEQEFLFGFQSRFGPTQWLRPYISDMVSELAASGIKRVAVVTPGFVSDCVETLEEIAIELKTIFLENGGTHFTAIPCLNDSDGSIALLANIVRDAL